MEEQIATKVPKYVVRAINKLLEKSISGGAKNYIRIPLSELDREIHNSIIIRPSLAKLIDRDMLDIKGLFKDSEWEVTYRCYYRRDRDDLKGAYDPTDYAIIFDKKI